MKLPTKTQIIAYAILIMASVVTLGPTYWMITSALKPEHSMLYSRTPTFFFTPSSRWFERLSTAQYGFLRIVINSMIISFGATGLSILLGIFAAYAFARYDFSHKEDLAFYMLSYRFMPTISVIIPLFLIYKGIGLNDTHIGLIFLYTVFNLPFAVWMLRSFIEEIPGK